MPDAARSLVALLALALACEWPIPAVAGEPDTTKACKMECPKYLEKKLPLSLLESYTVSTCRAKTSIILKTKKNREFCANGEDAWVKKVMQNIDARTRYSTNTENLPVANRHSGETKLEIEGQAQPTKEVSTTSSKAATVPVRTTGNPQPFVERGLEATTPSTWLAPHPETLTDQSTLQPDLITNDETGPEILEAHTRLGEHFTATKEGLEDSVRTTQQLVSPPTPFPGTDKTRTQSPAFVSEALMNPSTRPSVNSSISKLLLEFVTKDKTSVTIPTKLPNSSNQPRLLSSSFSPDHKPQSVEGSTTQFPTNSSSPSSTESGSDKTSLSSLQFQDVIDAEHKGEATKTPLSIGTGTFSRNSSKSSDTLRFPGYHQEMFNENSSISNPNTPPSIVDCFPRSQPLIRNYIILGLSVVGILWVLLAVGGLVYVKCNICTKRSPKRQVQGLMYYPCDSQAESYPMEMV